MRLWHYSLIPYLPRQQLLGQHRECCALRGNGWGRKHATVDYVFRYPPAMLYQYHMEVIDEMDVRGYKASPEWRDPYYRGKNCTPHTYILDAGGTIQHYPEHTFEYWNECLRNLFDKGLRELHATIYVHHRVDRITLNLTI